MFIRKIFIYLILIFIFIIRYFFSIPDCENYKNICFYQNYEEINIVGIVDSEIENSFNKQTFNLKVFKINSENIKGTVNVNYFGKEKLNFYDKINILCEIKKIEGNYKIYLENKNIYVVCNVKKLDYENINEGLFLRMKYNIYIFAYKIKNGIIDRIKDVYDEKYQGFLISFLIGDKRFISKRLENLLINAGLSHITSISGVNINILVSFLSFVFIGAGINRRKVLYIITPILIIFGIMTGLNPPVVRAIIMTLIILFIQNLGMPYKPLDILSFTGFIMCFINPKMIFDLSFLLSFLSCFSIIFLNPKIKKILKIKGDFFNIKENLISTLGIFIVTSPVIYIFFNKLNFIGIINNVLVLFFVPYIYFFGFLSLAIKPFSTITVIILKYLYLIIEI